jgi:Zn-finger nucleic acid-binding protein
MICPNDNIEMHQVKIQSHYGQPVILEQCGECGGIWFDESELYRAKQGEAEKIELLDSEMLWALSTIENTKHICPRDQTELSRFTDRYFPEGIIVERCPVCSGFWLNRGEFTKYQKARQELLRPKEKSPEDIKLQENIQKILELHKAGDADNTLGKLARFLSKPIDENTLLTPESAPRSPAEENTLNTVLNVLITVLRLFVFR